MKISLTKLRERSEYIKETHHPEFPLIIWNYTPKAQYDKVWDEYTIQCRGLITDEDGEIISRPFKKFFNLNETPETTLTNLPNTTPSITEKLDGSLGISYFHSGIPYIATRGSFTSEQAAKGNELLQYRLRLCNPEYTYLFELIYPGNRIVVDYGRVERTPLISIIHTATGHELTGEEFIRESERCGLEDRAGNFPGTIEGALEVLKGLDGTKGEGFVFRYPNGLRFKAKSEDYKRLHFLLTGFSTRSIWEILKEGGSIEEVLEAVPDEFYEWVTSQANYLQEMYDIEFEMNLNTYEIIRKLPTRKEQAISMANDDPESRAIVFALLDGKDPAPIIWEGLKPPFSKPFKTETWAKRKRKKVNS